MSTISNLLQEAKDFSISHGTLMSKEDLNKSKRDTIFKDKKIILGVDSLKCIGFFNEAQKQQVTYETILGSSASAVNVKNALKRTLDALINEDYSISVDIDYLGLNMSTMLPKNNQKIVAEQHSKQTLAIAVLIVETGISIPFLSFFG